MWSTLAFKGSRVSSVQLKGMIKGVKKTLSFQGEFLFSIEKLL